MQDRKEATSIKIVKRDGRIVEYDSNKIRVAIEKANAQVTEDKRLDKKKINEIIIYIESLNKKRMLVEDIQDIIEEKLMNYKKYDLAKVYIIYRYTRALIRKSNFTDGTILEIIKNSSRNSWDKRSNLVMTKRNLIADLVSKDLTTRVLLPEKIADAHEKGYIYFNDMDTFIQPSINTSHINLDDMLINGTVVNGNEVTKIKNFVDACLISTQIAFEVANGQYGDVFLEVKHLLKYLKTDDDIKQGINVLLTQFNNMVTIYGKPIGINMMLELDEAKERNLKFYEEILKCSWNSNVKLIYMFSTNVFNEIIKKHIKKGLNIKIITNKNMINCYKFDQGIVSINLADINQDNIDTLNDRLELCHEALTFKHHSLMGTLAMSSPIHYLYGAVARISEEKIDKLLKNGFSTLTLGYSGLREMINLVGVDNTLTIFSQIKKVVKKWSDDDNLDFRLQPVFDDDVCCYFSISNDNNISKQCYSNYIDIDDIYERMKLENRVGVISKVQIGEEAVEKIFKYIEENKLNIEFMV